MAPRCRVLVAAAFAVAIASNGCASSGDDAQMSGSAGSGSGSGGSGSGGSGSGGSGSSGASGMVSSGVGGPPSAGGESGAASGSGGTSSGSAGAGSTEGGSGAAAGNGGSGAGTNGGSSPSSGSISASGGATTGGASGSNGAGGSGSAVDYDVYLLAGQSNMDGRGLVKDLSAAQSMPLPGAFIYYRFPPFSGDAKAFTTNGFTALVPGFSVPPSYAGALPSTTFGPEVGFAVSLRQTSPNRTLALIKGTRGGTSLVNHWKPGIKGEPSTQGVCYREYLTTLGLAKSALQKDGHSFAIRALIWHQGESDVDAGVTEAGYTQQLQTFITRIREDVGDPNLPIVVGEVYEDGNRGAIRAAQRKVATSTPHVAFVSADGLVTLDAGTHFDAASQLTLGQRFAEALPALLAL